MRRHSVLLGLVCAVLIGGSAYAQEPLSEADMALARGGYLMADGIKFDFGAVVRTFDNDKLALETQVVWGPNGAVVSQSPGGASSSGGATFTHNIVGNSLSNLVTNTDSNRNIRLETNLTIVLPSFAAAQAEMGHTLASLRLVDDLAVGSIGSLGH